MKNKVFQMRVDDGELTFLNDLSGLYHCSKAEVVSIAVSVIWNSVIVDKECETADLYDAFMECIGKFRDFNVADEIDARREAERRFNEEERKRRYGI